MRLVTAFLALLLIPAALHAEPLQRPSGSPMRGEQAQQQPAPVMQSRGEPVHKPAPGTALRAALLDSIRPVFEGETWGPVEFVVRNLSVSGSWAFGDVKLQRPGGKPIDWSRTRYAEDMRQGMFDPAGSFFLLYRLGSSWAIVKFATGPTDVAWDGWRTEYGLPSELFGPMSR